MRKHTGSTAEASHSAPRLPAPVFHDPKHHRERKYFFIGLLRRDVIYSVAAESLEEAWNLFLSSSKREIPIFSVIKTETEIYLAQSS